MSLLLLSIPPSWHGQRRGRGALACLLDGDIGGSDRGGGETKASLYFDWINRRRGGRGRCHPPYLLRNAVCTATRLTRPGELSAQLAYSSYAACVRDDVPGAKIGSMDPICLFVYRGGDQYQN